MTNELFSGARRRASRSLPTDVVIPDSDVSLTEYVGPYTPWYFSDRLVRYLQYLEDRDAR